MNDKNLEDFGRFDSLDCVNLIFEGEDDADTTVRPCPPELLAQLKAEHEKLVRWGDLKAETQNLEVDG
jgi:hypothetical protein